MTETAAERKWAENEAVFRQANERIQQELAELRQNLSENKETAVPANTDAPIYFICECADENCHERIRLKPSQYRQLHQNSSQFVIVPGHSVAAIERVVQKNGNYVVVEKYETPPAPGDGLNSTSINNA